MSLRTPDLGGAVPVGRYVVDTSDGEHLACCWSDCWKRGLLLHRVRIYEGVHPVTRRPVYSWKIFCSERHKMLYVNAPRSLNNLPPGHRLAIC
jgi:hypothetical protein